MNTEYYNQIAKSTANRKSRDDNKDFIFANPDYLKFTQNLKYEKGHPDFVLNVKEFQDQ